MSKEADPRGWITGAFGETRVFKALEALPGSELWSLLLELAGRRAQVRSPAEVLRQWERDPFTLPSDVDPRVSLRAELRTSRSAW